MDISNKEKEILRNLAKEVAELAAEDKNQKKIEKWTRINDLDTSAEPVFMTHLWQISHKEIFPDSNFKCESEAARYYEDFLNRKIYFAKHVDDDNVVEPVVYYNVDAWIKDYPELGVEIHYVDGEAQGAHEFIPVLNEEEDIEKIADPVLHYNKENSERFRSEAIDLFGGILQPVQRPYYFAAKVVDEYSWLRGMENTYMDMAANPDWMHAALQKITDNYIKRFTLLEEAGIWGVADKSDPLGSAGLRYISGMKDWKDAKDPSTYRPKLSDSWGFTCAEVCNCVSQDMHDEFGLKYDRQIMDMFKYWNVGCCETLDRKVEIVKSIPNARKVSISEWCDVKKGAEAIGSDYVYSYRAAGVPFISEPEWDIKAATDEISGVVKATQESKSPLEIILNIGGTFGKGDARQKLNEWTKMVRDQIDAI